jgi:porphobilinogen synthase
MTPDEPLPLPRARPRRLRRTESIRAMVRETILTPERLVAPLFVHAGRRARVPVPSMPGVFRLSPEAARDEAKALARLGVGGVILFGIPGAKDAAGSGARDPEGPVSRALGMIKAAAPRLQAWADVCLCEYTDHGHCGVLDARGAVRNDATLPLLAEAAVVAARAGADAVCPSDMMDGRVAAIRAALDRAGFADTLLVSYAVKYASAFYGPFRDAAGSTPRRGDRRGYQMDPGNAREALREAALDEAEGADVLMVKPALAYLDVVRRVREATALPVAAYCVSGEYAMIEAAAARGWIDRDRAVLESLGSVRRAGADLVLTYHAARAARLLG